MEYKYLKIELNDYRLDLTINNPPVNILTGAVMQEMITALKSAKENKSLRSVVIWGEGKAWSAGADVSEHLPGKFEDMLDVFGELCELVRTFPKPTVAAVDGMCLGGGCEVACMCDFVLASERSKFGQPEIAVGVLPPVACAHFGSKYGLSHALEIVLTGDAFDAENSARLGMINRLLPVEGFKEGVDKFVKKLTTKSAAVLEITKAAALKGFGENPQKTAYEVDDIYRSRLMKTKDAVEGLNAFLEKRKAEWKDE